MAIYGFRNNDLIVKDLTVKDTLTFGDAATDALTVNGAATFNYNVTIGDAVTDVLILKGRVATGSAAGSALNITSSYAYAEGIELRSDVSNWTGCGNTYSGLYLRASTSLGNASGNLNGAQILGVANLSSTTGLNDLKSLYCEMLVKATSSSYTLTGGTSIEGNISIENITGTLTITNNIYCIHAKAQTGTGLADYTKINGIKISGRNDGVAKVYGTALDIADPEATVCTWTKAISISTACTSGIVISAATTTGLTISGATTNAISIPVTAASTCALLIGASISSGMPMSSTKNGLVRAFGEIQATEALSNDIRGGWFRVRQNGNADITGGYSTVGLQGTFKMYGHTSGTTTALWNASGVYGSFESDGVASSSVSSGGFIAGVFAQLGLGANFTIDSGAISAALVAMSNCSTSVTATGSFAGIYIGKQAGCKSFTNAIEIAGSIATTGISMGACTTGLAITGTTSNAIYITGDSTTAIMTNTGTFGTGLSLAGSLTTAIAISACTTGIDMNGSMTDGISISGSMDYPIKIASSTGATCAILIGASISDGLHLTSTANGMIRAFGEINATETLSNDIRGGWFRVRQNGNANVDGGYSTVGLQGSYKMYGHGSGTTTALWNASGVYGSFESDGVASASVSTGGYIAGVFAQIGLGANFTIDSGAVSAALIAMSNCNSGVTATGTFDGIYVGVQSGMKAFTKAIEIANGAATNGIFIGNTTTAVNISGTSTTGVSISGATTNAISITPSAASTCALLIGTGISAGMPMTSTKNGLVRAFGEIQSTEALANDIRGGWFRVRQNADVDVSGGYSTVGLQGSFKMYGGSAGTTTALWNASGVYGSFESDGVASSSVSTGGYIAGVFAQLGLLANFTIDSGAVAAALIAMSNCNSSMTATGSFAGLYVGLQAGCKAFTNGIQIADSVSTTGISVGTSTTGINFAGTYTSAINVAGTGATASARAFKGAMSVADANYGDGYGLVESELTLTGTAAGEVSALTSWINIITGNVSGQRICAQSNGIYAESGSTMTGATVIFGMRAQCLCQSEGDISEMYPFSIVNNTNITTALIQCNDASSDLGRITNAGADSGTLIPLYKDNSGVKYVKIYTAV